jgi:hypothetical protein
MPTKGTKTIILRRIASGQRSAPSPTAPEIPSLSGSNASEAVRLNEQYRYGRLDGAPSLGHAVDVDYLGSLMEDQWLRVFKNTLF